MSANVLPATVNAGNPSEIIESFLSALRQTDPATEAMTLVEYKSGWFKVNLGGEISSYRAGQMVEQTTRMLATLDENTEDEREIDADDPDDLVDDLAANEYSDELYSDKALADAEAFANGETPEEPEDAPDAQMPVQTAPAAPVPSPKAHSGTPKATAPTAASATAPKTTTTSRVGSFGLLCWWTVYQGNREVGPLVKAISEIPHMPNWAENLTGSKAQSAWLRATQLGAAGVESYTEEEGVRARYLVRDAGEDAAVRILIREEIDAAEAQVSVQNIGTLAFSSARLLAFEPDAQYLPYKTEVDNLIDGMLQDMSDRIGKIDESRIRGLVLRWLESKFRVCVRGTGGVYFVPTCAGDDHEETRQEMVAIRKWFTTCNIGTFSLVELHESDATSVEDFQRSAVSELEAELRDVMENITRYSGNANMNDGSKMFSASKMVERLDSLTEKATTLEESLGEVLGVLSVQMNMVRAAASKMLQESSAAVAVVRAAKNAERDAATAQRKTDAEKARAERLAAVASVKKSTNDGKKAGTAKERGSKKQL